MKDDNGNPGVQEENGLKNQAGRKDKIPFPERIFAKDPKNLPEGYCAFCGRRAESPVQDMVENCKSFVMCSACIDATKDAFKEVKKWGPRKK